MVKTNLKKEISANHVCIGYYKIAILLYVALFFLLNIPILSAEQKQSYATTKEELKYLPEFCVARQNIKHSNHPIVKKWRKRFGPDFIHLLHY
ncbi:hypothetical protein [Desulfobacula sp.]|uniref:hypothetical protein n=1 Tax=Desulfobacula sp. TaxID=2593537 RepID=UPI0026399381|nr:hypothetical protein [Desulfobacula sp.]